MEAKAEANKAIATNKNNVLAIARKYNVLLPLLQSE